MRRTSTLALLVLMASAPPALGDVGVVVVGEKAWQQLLTTQLEGWLRQRGHEPVPTPLPEDAIGTLVDCFVLEDERCGKAVIEARSKSADVVFARLDVQPDPDHLSSVTLAVYWFHKGELPLAERRTCAQCSDISFRSTAEQLMAALAAAGATRKARSTGVLKLTSRPPGARIAIGGKTLGVTPIERDLPANTYKVTVVHAGGPSETRDVTIRGGETVVLDVARAERARKSSPVLPFMLFGVGGAAVLAGTILIVIDEDKKMGGGGRDVRDTAPLGVGLVAAGVAVGAVGGYLWLRASRSSAPVAAIIPGGGVVGWTARF